jgi:O-methyltransferase involved in polyketide biosynthesis
LTISESELQTLSGVAETLLIPLYLRAMESQRPDALLKDEKAVALVTQSGYDFDRIRKIPMTGGNKVARIMLTREMAITRDFLIVTRSRLWFTLGGPGLSLNGWTMAL